MRRRLLSVFAALVLVLSAGTASIAHSQGYPVGWGNQPGSGSGYSFQHHIPVCFHENFDGGYEWNLNDPQHAAVNNAMGLWNAHAVATSGDLFFYRSNFSCVTLGMSSVMYVQVGYSGYDLGALMRTDTYHGNFGGDHVQKVAIWINEIGHNFYWGTGFPGASNDAWTLLGHEFGHASQIAHYVPDFCGQGGDIMVSCFTAGQTNRSLSAHDKSHYDYWYD